MHQEFIWVRLQLTFTCCSLWINYRFVIESIDAFYLLTMLLFVKLFWCKERVVSLFTKYFFAKVVSLYLSAIWQFWPFQRLQTSIFKGAYGLSYSGGGLAQVGDKVQRWEVQKCEDTMSRVPIWVQGGYWFIGYSIGYFVDYCWVQLLSLWINMLPINTIQNIYGMKLYRMTV